MNCRGHCRKNNNIPQVEGTPVAPIPVTPAPSIPVAPAAPISAAPAPSVPVAHAPTPSGPAAPVPAATTTAAAAIATALHRPRRQQQLPQRYRGNNAAAHPDDGEYINIDNVSSSEDDINPPEAIADVNVNLSPLQTATSTLPTNPFATRKRSLKTTSNVQFFFRKNSDTGKHICVLCE
ncbi:hypothetical protein EV702DRAFT_1051648 [Suillus placidus]|uniref:Uncharacterized protein n=1 Tax=Suillus placidus TaxID=48579 RepID=A0A9P6ZFM6_9AGAM|nr:hypothetical protein EV702DRAFT_1051648 [Suillus placidus]